MAIGVVVAAIGATLSALDEPSDTASYRTWVTGPLPSWTAPSPYPLGATALWWPLRWYHGDRLALVWVLGWTVPATVVAAVLLWRNASHRVAAVTGWLVAAGLLGRCYWLRLEPVAAAIALAALLVARRRPAISGALLSAAALIKVWPLLLLPMCLLILPGPRRIRWLTGAATPWAALALAVAVAQPPHALTWATFAAGRRTQIESLTALGPMWAMAFGSDTWQTHYVRGLDSANLVFGPQLTTIHTVLQVAGAAGLVLLARRVWRTGLLRHPGRPDAVRIAAAAQVVVLLLLILAGPVFSPQYLTWFAPVLLVAVGEGQLRREAWAWGLACLLTVLEYPYLWPLIRQPHPLGLAVLTARDLVVVALLVLCWRQVRPGPFSRRPFSRRPFSRRRPATPAVPGPPRPGSRHTGAPATPGPGPARPGSSARAARYSPAE